jgi:RES domain-containing protein
LDMLDIRIDNASLDYMRDWKVLVQADRHWCRAVGSRLKAWAMIGRSLLVLYPGLDTADSVTLVYVKNTDTLTHISNVLEVPDKDLPQVLDVAESLLLLRERRLLSAEAAVRRFTTRLGLQNVEG